ncbi:Retrovirus-related Pol polyprotein from transposon RE1 [Vitis vinifera]|uniref:Retrovirus-related Pol polyprotein from transposon RE1 n=1 Tax=Vitis vinifera TaxID=29760 RepID=A0A438GFT7_VITVI|nr:Retrovirus-related Pol polyprotein from transposon RE1 [Vitis vinifera]
MTKQWRTYSNLQSLCDSLAAIAKPVLVKEKVFCLLTSLGPQYETFTTTMLKPPRPSYSELVSQLQSLDQRRNWFSNHANATHATPEMAFTDSNNKDIHNPPQDIKICMTPVERDLYREEKCQYCGMVGHIAKICWWVPKMPTQQDDIPQALEALTLDNPNAETEWTSDTGASNHMTDGGGEFMNFQLSSQFLSTGIIHPVSCPYTLEQTEALSTAIYLINRLPLSALNSKTPYFALHGTHPDYTSLRVFGSKCFPYTWDTRQHKFDPKTVLCIFVDIVINIKNTSAFIRQARSFLSRHVVELSEQSFNTPHNDIEPNQLDLQSQTHQKQPPQPQLAPYMITRSQRGIIKPNPNYALTSTTNSTSIPREPHNIRAALAHPGWKTAIDEELEALHTNKTWQVWETGLAANIVAPSLLHQISGSTSGGLSGLVLTFDWDIHRTVREPPPEPSIESGGA